MGCSLPGEPPPDSPLIGDAQLLTAERQAGDIGVNGLAAALRVTGCGPTTVANTTDHK